MSLVCDFSVMMITFNHEKFFSQAIESVLSQQFNGTTEIVIGVDKGTDNTLQISKRYQQQFPHLIKLIIHNENVGMYQNFMTVLKACTGRYIAILEGDDYWTEKKKLQIQYDFFKKTRLVY